jgi:hypothetical protein
VAQAIVKYSFHLDYPHAELGVRAVFEQGSPLDLSDERMALFLVEHPDSITPVDFDLTRANDRIRRLIDRYKAGQITIDGRTHRG